MKSLRYWIERMLEQRCARSCLAAVVGTKQRPQFACVRVERVSTALSRKPNESRHSQRGAFVQDLKTIDGFVKLK